MSIQQDYSSMCNQADIFTVLPSLLCDLQAVLDGLLSCIHQYCVFELFASLSRWCNGVLGTADTVYSVDTVYCALSGTLCSIHECAHMEAFIDTSATCCFVTSCWVLSYKASLSTPSQMLCWFSIPQDIGCGLDLLLYLPPRPSSGQLLGVCSVAAEEEHGMGGSINNSSILGSHFINSLYNSSIVGSPLINSSLQVVCPSPDGNLSSNDEYFLGVGFASMLSLSQNAAARSLGSFVLTSLDSSCSVLPPVADPQLVVGEAIVFDTIREGADFDTTDEVNFDQMATDEVANYSHVVIMPSVQRHRLLSLLEQALSLLTPNNPTSASFAASEYIPFSSWYSQRWRVAYEQESLCKLHTVYNYPGRFGTKGPFFYKLENYIADLCIVKPHHFWTRLREKELWLAAQFARWDVATNPVSNPLRFFDKHGNACFVPTDGPCYSGFEPGTIPQPRIQLSCGTASQINSKCFTSVAIRPMALMRAALLNSPSLILARLITSLSLILLLHSLTTTTKAL